MPFGYNAQRAALFADVGPLSAAESDRVWRRQQSMREGRPTEKWYSPLAHIAVLKPCRLDRMFPATSRDYNLDKAPTG
jgi:hypothetical protein